MKLLVLVLGVVLAACGPALAGGHHGCCADCGCNQGLKKVCRWICEEVEVKEPAWDCECEDIVIPGKSPFCIQEACDCCEERGHSLFGGRLHHKKLWGPPSGCCVKTVTLLLPTEKTVKKKVWKPVVETVCDTCCNRCAASGVGAAGCADGSVPAIDGVPERSPTIAPPIDSQTPPPPMPPVPGANQTSLGRGWNLFAPVFRPSSWQR